jgi:hypothetical protein
MHLSEDRQITVIAITPHPGFGEAEAAIGGVRSQESAVSSQKLVSDNRNRFASIRPCGLLI